MQTQVSENCLDERLEQRWPASISCKLSTQKLIWPSSAKYDLNSKKQGQRGAEELVASGYPTASQGFLSSLTMWEVGSCFAAGSCSSLRLLASQMLLGAFPLQIGFEIPCAPVLQKWHFIFLTSLVLDCVFKGYQSPGPQQRICSTPDLYSVCSDASTCGILTYCSYTDYFKDYEKA